MWPFKPNIDRMSQRHQTTELIKALDHRSAAVRRSAAQALGSAGARAALSSLAKACQDHDRGVSTAAAEALQHLVEMHFRHLSLNDLIAIGRPAVPTLIRTLDDLQLRTDAARALGSIGDPVAVRPLARALAATPVRHYAYTTIAYELSKFHDPAVIEPLLAALGAAGTRGQHRPVIEERLGGLGSGEAAVAILEALRGSPEKLLAKPDPRCVRALVVALREGEPNELRRSEYDAAAKALRQLSDRSVVESFIRELTESDDSDVRVAAAQALGNLGDTAATSALLQTVRTPHPQPNNSLVQDAAISALGALGDAAAVVPLLDRLGHSRLALRPGERSEIWWVDQDYRGLIVRALVRMGGASLPEIERRIVREEVFLQFLDGFRSFEFRLLDADVQPWRDLLRRRYEEPNAQRLRDVLWLCYSPKLGSGAGGRESHRDTHNRGRLFAATGDHPDPGNPLRGLG